MKYVLKTASNSYYQELADEMDLEISDIKNVISLLDKYSKENAGYGVIDEEQIDLISDETYVRYSDVKELALKLGFNVE